MVTVSDLYTLNSRAKTAEYGGAYYSYDRLVAETPLVEIPTAEICNQEFTAAQLLKTSGFLLDPKPLAEIDAYLIENGFEMNLANPLVDRRILVVHRSPVEIVERRVLDYFNRRYLPQAAGMYDEGGASERHTLSPNTFFNLPRTVDSASCQVGLLGVPAASVRASLGSITGPAHLRMYSRSMCWFEIHDQGLYSEIALDQGRPQVMGHGVVVRDCGDVECEGATVEELHERIEEALSREFFDHGAYPLIVGGDHAITYPVVRSFLERVPDLGLLHLDAHNDLFYSSQVVYSHAAPISNLLMATGIQRIVSFGLRTFADTRMAGLKRVYEEGNADKRLRLRPLAATRQMILEPGRLNEEFDTLAGRPYYLTIDLDVLSEAVVGVSTPFGAGLEWHELLTFLDAAFRRLHIIGCDIVEHNSLNGDSREDARYPIVSLLLLIIDRLARNNPKVVR